MSQINESAIATPGVYVTEIPAFPPSVAQVATAIPVFVGYAPQAVQNGKSVYNTAVRISSLIEFTTYFGTGFDDLKANVTLNATANGITSVYFQNASLTSGTIGFQLFNAIQMFFNQGGSNCYILAIPFGTSPEITDFLPIGAGKKTIFDIIQKEDEPTLIVVPDAVLFGINDFGNLMNGALQLCGQMQDRFTIMDVLNGNEDHDGSSTDPIPPFRNAVSNPALNYGAAYYPYLTTSLPYTPTNPNSFAYADINIYESGGTSPVPGSTVLNSTFANQIELADADMSTIIAPFMSDPNLAALPGAFTSPTLGAAIGKAAVGSGFSMIPQAPQVTSLIEITNKLTYIDELLKAFVSLPAFTDNQPTVSTQVIYNGYIAASPASATPAYTQIELLLKELFLLNESFPSATDTASNLITPPLKSIGGYTNINDTNIPPDVTIYGPAANDDAYVLVTRPRVITLYNNVLNYINSFVNDVNNRINGLDQQLAATSPLYTLIQNAIANEGLIVPPSGAMAGVYAAVDGSRGVWKAPANVALNSVIGPAVDIDDNTQSDLNIDPQTGKSVNAIRAFTGKGTLVWGARTLTGNDNDFRYISVRRFYIMVEESVKLAAYQFVFEPNDAKTWTRIRAMIENYLTNLWRQGALAGPKPEAAFWVKVGLGQTMIFQDVLEGRMIVEIGMAPVRPAEFIILRFTQIQQTA